MFRTTPFAAALIALLLPLAAFASPKWTRLSWTGPTDSSITVSWTDSSPGTGQVEYRPVGGAPLTAPATGTATSASALGATYVARISGLTPSTSYEYRVTSGGASSAWATFRTAPSAGSCSPVRLVAGGDSRGESLLGYMASGQWDDVAKAMAAESPLAVLHTGDYVRDGDKAEQWAKELPLLEPLSGKVPFFLALGNHDTGPGSGAGAIYNQLFEYPANGTDAVDDYYSMVIGNVLVVTLSTHTYSIDTQLAWLRTVLEAHRDTVDWRVVIFHVPVWSSGAHGSNEGDKTRAATLVPLLDEYGVDLVFNGHDHDYERFNPSKGGYGGVPRVLTPLALDNGKEGNAQGTIYLVTGGAGALVNPVFSQTVTGSAKGSNRLHYVVLDAAAGALTLTVRDCGSQGFGGASCSGSLEIIRLTKSAKCGTGVDGGTAADAGIDAGGADAGTVDAGSQDAGASDAGWVDSDAGVADAGSSLDAGTSGGAAVADGGGEIGVPVGRGCGCAGGGVGALIGLLGLAIGWGARRVRGGGR